MLIKFVHLFVVLLSLPVGAAERRIKSVDHDISKAGVIKIAPGLASNVELPCVVEEVNPGLENLVHVSVSKVNPKRIVLVAQGGSSSTNIIVHCQEKSFVFDLFIQNGQHNDLIKIAADFGEYGYDSSDMVLLKSSSQARSDRKQFRSIKEKEEDNEAQLIPENSDVELLFDSKELLK
jgi:hypothetical protein